jgi:hypothetical protein
LCVWLIWIGLSFFHDYVQKETFQKTSCSLDQHYRKHTKISPKIEQALLVHIIPYCLWGYKGSLELSTYKAKMVCPLRRVIIVGQPWGGGDFGSNPCFCQS